MTIAVAERHAIRAAGVSKRFSERSVLRSIDLAVRESEILVVVGESGCGKSTLLRLFARLETADAGAVDVHGQISIAFQDARLMPWLPVWENVAFGLPLASSVRRERAFAALNEVGLARLANAWPATLSGGEAQRVALARALIRDPAVLLLDEPFGALDALTRLRMHALLSGLWERHRFTTVLVTHDVDEALSLGDRIVVLGAGRIVDQFNIELARPRNWLDRTFGTLRDRLLGELGVPSGLMSQTEEGHT
jgi:sulfonate transport system ATP-binding protein